LARGREIGGIGVGKDGLKRGSCAGEEYTAVIRLDIQSDTLRQGRVKRRTYHIEEFVSVYRDTIRKFNALDLLVKCVELWHLV
jgi:hypothetical protein